MTFITTASHPAPHDIIKHIATASYTTQKTQKKDTYVYPVATFLVVVVRYIKGLQ